MLRVNFIGCGRLGKTIAKLLAMNNAAIICGIVNSTLESGKQAVSFVGQGAAFCSIEDLPIADIYFITTNDAYITKACEELLVQRKLSNSSIVVHCSGSQPSNILISAKKAFASIASVHPVRSFANPDATVNSFKGTFCAFEGDRDAYISLKPIFEGIGGVIFSIQPECKKKYHAAMVMANNYLVTLHYHAMQNLISSGVEEEIAKKLVSNMMTDAFNNVLNLDHRRALTGPLQRGDIQTIRSHLASLSEDQTASNIYAALGSGTLPITSHSSEVKKEFEEIFNNCLTNAMLTHTEHPPITTNGLKK